MTNVELPYHLNDPKRMARLLELAGTPNPTALEGELAVARMLQEEALNLGQTAVALSLLNVIGKLAQASEIAKYRRGELLAKTAILTLAHKMVETLASNIKGRFDGWEQALENVQHEILTLVRDARNPEHPQQAIDVQSAQMDEQPGDGQSGETE